MNIVYVGGMTVSAHILEALCQAGEVPSHVFGYPPSLSHRSSYASFDDLACEYGFPLTETENINAPDVEQIVRDAAPDWIMVFGWSQLVKQRVYQLAKHGGLGLHMSKLPLGRGRAPVPWTLIKGLSDGAVTLFWLAPGADEGDIAVQRQFEVSAFDDAHTLVERVTKIARDLVVEAIPQLRDGRLPRLPQNNDGATYWPKRTPEDGRIDWTRPIREIYNLVRGVTAPFPGAFTHLDEEKVFLWRVGMLEAPVDAPPGTILGPYWSHGTEPVVGLAIAANGGVLVCHTLQFDGQDILQGSALHDLATRCAGHTFDTAQGVTTKPEAQVRADANTVVIGDSDPVAQGVLSVYQRVNPSTYAFENDAYFNNYSEFYRRLFLDYLKLPPSVFQGANVLEFGAGNGEHSLFLALAGSHLTCVEINSKAVERFEFLMQRFGVREQVKEMRCQSLFDWRAPPGTKYDLVVANGVLPHTSDPRLGFSRLVDNLREGGFAIVGGACSSGCFQRNLQRYILFSLSNSEEDLVDLAKRLFKEHLDRSVQIGGRSLEAIVYDTYVNPKIHTFSAAEILAWFNEEGLRFYSSWPPVTPSGLGDSYKQPPVWIEEEPFRYSTVGSDLSWLVHTQEDREVFLEESQFSRQMWERLREVVDPLADITPENYGEVSPERLVAALDSLADGQGKSAHNSYFGPTRERIGRFREEVANVLKLTAQGRVDELEHAINQASILFRGTSGLGMNFFVGYRK